MGIGPNALMIEESLDESVPQSGYVEDFRLFSGAGTGSTDSPLDAAAKGLGLATSRNFTFVCPGHIAPNAFVRAVLTLAIPANSSQELTISGKIIRRNGTTVSLSGDTRIVNDTSFGNSAVARHADVAYSWAGAFAAGDVISFTVVGVTSDEVILLAAFLRAKRHASLANVKSRTTTTLTF